MGGTNFWELQKPLGRSNNRNRFGGCILGPGFFFKIWGGVSPAGRNPPPRKSELEKAASAFGNAQNPEWGGGAPDLDVDGLGGEGLGGAAAAEEAGGLPHRRGPEPRRAEGQKHAEQRVLREGGGRRGAMM